MNDMNDADEARDIAIEDRGIDEDLGLDPEDLSDGNGWTLEELFTSP